MDTLELTRLDSRFLAYLISFLGKNSIDDETALKIKELIFEHFKNGKASILDIIEVLSALLNIDILDIRVLQEIDLDTDFSWAKELGTAKNIVPYLRYFEILATAQIAIP